MSRAETIAKLKAVPLFQNCTGRQLRRIAESGNEGSFEPGHVIFEEGTFADEFFVILEGRADVREGRRKLRTLVASDYFGEIALVRSTLLERSRRTATVTAVEPLRCFRLGRSQFNALLYEGDIAVKILRAVVERLDP